MLEKLILHNFKSHKSTELNFDNSRLHGIVGKNSAGKTSVLQALHYLSMITNTSFEKIFKYDRSPQFITTIGEKNMSVTASGYWENQKNCQVSYRLENKNTNNWIAKLSWNIDGNKSSWTNEKLYGSYSYSPQDPPLPSNFFKPTVYLKLIASNLAKPAYSEEITPRVEFDGSLLAPTLDFIRDEAPDKFQLIEEKLSRIVPNVRKVGIKRAKVRVIRKRLIEVDGKSISYEETQEMTGQEVVLDMNTGERIPAHAIS
ncbi:MAG: ATPase, partial [Anabaena sp. CRKS33]